MGSTSKDVMLPRTHVKEYPACAPVLKCTRQWKDGLYVENYGSDFFFYYEHYEIYLTDLHKIHDECFS